MKNSHNTSGVNATSFWEAGHSIAYDTIVQALEPWNALDLIPTMITDYMSEHGSEDWLEPVSGVFVHRTAEIHESTILVGPAIIGAGSIIGPHAFIRHNVIIGDHCQVGNTSEVKQAILFDGVQIPHFNYVGDSILGYKAHLGAGAICSNYRSDQSEVQVYLPENTGSDPAISTPDKRHSTGLRKFGCLLGDMAEIGCNSVLNPGTLGEREIRVYPLSSVRGYIPANHIYKQDGTLVRIKE